MKIIDISMAIKKEMKVYKNKDEKRPELMNTSNYEIGDHYESKISMDLHTGTHMDAPLHMIKDGSTIEKTDLSKCMGKARVLDMTHIADGIQAKDLEEKQVDEGDIILLKTQNSYKEEFDFNFIYLKADGASYLVNKGVKAIGIDALGIERGDSEHTTHKTILGQGIPIIEGLSLRDVEEGQYEFIGLPLKIQGGEGAPLRAVLIQR